MQTLESTISAGVIDLTHNERRMVDSATLIEWGYQPDPDETARVFERYIPDEEGVIAANGLIRGLNAASLLSGSSEIIDKDELHLTLLYCNTNALHYKVRKNLDSNINPRNFAANLRFASVDFHDTIQGEYPRIALSPAEFRAIGKKSGAIALMFSGEFEPDFFNWVEDARIKFARDVVYLSSPRGISNWRKDKLVDRISDMVGRVDRQTGRWQPHMTLARFWGRVPSGFESRANRDVGPVLPDQLSFRLKPQR